MMRRRAPSGPTTAQALVCAAIVLAAWAAGPAAVASAQSNPLQLTVQGRASGDVAVRPLREYGTRELGDPWDMDQRTDLGWFTWGIDNPPSLLASKRMTADAAGLTVFEGSSSQYGPSVFLLDPWVPDTGRLGKIGVNHPIDTSVYTTLYVKLKVANTILNTAPVTQVFWSRDTIYHDPSSRPAGGTIAAFDDQAGNQAGLFVSPYTAPTWGRLEGGTWVIARIPLTIAAMQANNATIDRWRNMATGATVEWGAAGVLADSLRLSPFNINGTAVGTFQIDWVRLVDDRDPAGVVLSWSGGAHDVVVSTRPDCGNFAVVAYSQSPGFVLKAGLLPAARYYVGLRKPFTYTGHTAPAPTALASCSAATVTVGAMPGLALTSPRPDGSADDFADSVLGNPWDFDTLADIDVAHEIQTSPTADPEPYGIVNRPATDVNGAPIDDGAAIRMLRSWTDSGTCADHQPPSGGCTVGDPHMYLLWPSPASAGARARGEHLRIDASRYRIFSADVGVEWDRDLLSGSLGRVVWHVDGDTRLGGGLVEIESAEIVLRHLPPAANGGQPTLDTIQVDLADRGTLPIEHDHTAWPSGWNNACVPLAGVSTCDRSAPTYRPGVSAFRYDLHEFSGREADGQTVRRRMPATVRRLRLAALERTGAAFDIAWAPSNPSGMAATVSLTAVPELNPAQHDRRPRDRACRVSQGALPIAGGLALGQGRYTWAPAATPGVTPGQEYYVCAQILVDGQVVDEELSRWPVVVAVTYDRLLTSRPGELRFAALKGAGATLQAVTAPQSVQVDGPPLRWTATVDRPWLQITNGTGTGAGQFTATIVNPGNVIGDTAATLTGTVTLTAPPASGLPDLSIPVVLTVQVAGAQATAPPFGYVDTPTAGGTGLQGTVGVTGWALDDVGIASVRVYRSCLPFEPAANCAAVAGRPVVFVGDATRVAGARPDVESLYPRLPDASRAAWGYAMLTNLLPHVPAQQMFGGQGELTFHVLATDVEGRSTWLQWPVPPANTSFSTQATVALANNAMTRPFGAIDTPAQGATVSGMLTSFGWALTPDLDTTSGNGDVILPPSGATVRLFIDGVPGQAVAYDQCRGSLPRPVFCDDDIGNIFGRLSPQPPLTPRTSNPTRFRNLDAGRGAIGSATIDTTGLSNGLHTIMWGVTDSAGRSEGLGSRYFSVLNSGARAAADPSAAAAAPAITREALQAIPVSAVRTPGRVGVDLDAPLRTVPADADGVRHVRLEPMGRLELRLAAGTEGYWMAGDELRALPLGSHLDRRTGVFTWAPPAGFLGAYRLEFVGGGDRVPVAVTVAPPAAETGPVLRMHLEAARTDAGTGAPTTVRGWALDPLAPLGSGVDAVHVWAERLDAPGTPQLLGAATLDRPSPDAARRHGPASALAGFSLDAALPPGTYRVTAYAWASRTTRWEDARSVVITVR